MIKKIVIVLTVCFFPASAHAVTYDDILAHKANSSKPYWGDYYQYKNIEWISHQPYFEGATDEQMKELEKAALEEVDDRGQIDIGSVDSDGKLELITFAGVPDPNMSGMVDDKKPFEPRFADRFLRVSIYKYKDGTLKLSRQYLTKGKYEPHYVPVDKGLPK